MSNRPQLMNCNSTGIAACCTDPLKRQPKIPETHIVQPVARHPLADGHLRLRQHEHKPGQQAGAHRGQRQAYVFHASEAGSEVITAGLDRARAGSAVTRAVTLTLHRLPLDTLHICARIYAPRR